MDFERVMHWIPVIRIGSILGRNYDMFGCLFGIRSQGHFRAIAPMRGIPIDASYELRGDLKEIADSEWRDEFYGYTWITWEEIKSIDWEEEAEELKARKIAGYGGFFLPVTWRRWACRGVRAASGWCFIGAFRDLHMTYAVL